MQQLTKRGWIKEEMVAKLDQLHVLIATTLIISNFSSNLMHISHNTASGGDSENSRILGFWIEREV